MVTCEFPFIILAHEKMIGHSRWTRFTNGLPRGKEIILCIGGHWTLVNAVLSSIRNYWTLNLDLPNRVICKIDMLHRAFLLKGHDQCLGGHCTATYIYTAWKSLVPWAWSTSTFSTRPAWWNICYIEEDNPWRKLILKLYRSRTHKAPVIISLPMLLLYFGITFWMFNHSVQCTPFSLGNRR